MDRQRLLSYFKQQSLSYHPFKERWNYEDGCLLKGFLDLWQSGEDALYFNQVSSYLKDNINDSGYLKGYHLLDYSTDDVATGVILFLFYQMTGQRCYRLAIEQLMSQLRHHPRTKNGSFWHKKIYPHQVWLDGLYMAQPFYARYLKLRYGEEADYSDTVKQFLFVEQNMKDPLSKLYYHGYDESRTQGWANNKSGLSISFWSRSMGWLAMALVDVIEVMGCDHPSAMPLVAMLRELIQSLLAYQDSDSLMWYQVTDKAVSPLAGNYLEVSATMMFCYSLVKGYRLTIFGDDYLSMGKASFEATVDRFLKNGQFGNMCAVAGLGKAPYSSENSYRDGSEEYYYSEPMVDNDPKGIGVAMMALAQIILQEKMVKC